MNIRQIAYLAGVSVATVSRCLNSPEKVAEQTREKVLAVMKKMEYAPNPYARSLTTGSTNTVLCIVPTLCNEFFTQIVEGAQKVLEKEGYRILVYSNGDEANMWENLDQRGIDGMIVSGSGLLGGGLQDLSTIKVPFVMIENIVNFEKNKDQFSCVYSDDCEGVKMVLDYLYQEGNRKFGVISTDDEYPVTTRRFLEVQKFFNRRLDCTLYLEQAHYSRLAESREACRRLMNREDPPTAIFAFNDMMAVAALRYLKEQKIAVPDEVEVVGFDDNPVARYLSPSLTTVFAPNRKLGEKAAEVLVEQLRGKGETQKILFPVELKLRETTKNI